MICKKMLDTSIQEVTKYWKSIMKHRSTQNYINYEFNEHCQYQDIITDWRTYFSTTLQYHKILRLAEVLESIKQTSNDKFFLQND